MKIKSIESRSEKANLLLRIKFLFGLSVNYNILTPEIIFHHSATLNVHLIRLPRDGSVVRI